jgi:hypothetical protein
MCHIYKCSFTSDHQTFCEIYSSSDVSLGVLIVTYSSMPFSELFMISATMDQVQFPNTVLRLTIRLLCNLFKVKRNIVCFNRDI